MSGPVATVAIGLVAGVLSGAFGVGGGIVTTPAIRLLLGYPALIAVGTPLPVIVPTALAGAWSYHRAGLIDVRAGLAIGLWGLPMTLLGAWLSDLAGGSVVMLVTAALVLYTAVDFVSGARRGAPVAVQRDPRGFRLAALGMVAGLYSGFLGLGGGFVVVPLLMRLFGVPMKRAIGTSLLAVCLFAIPGTAAHWWLGHVDFALAFTMALGVVPGAFLGARLTHASSERAVRYAFAVLLVVTGLALVANEVGLLG